MGFDNYEIQNVGKLKKTFGDWKQSRKLNNLAFSLFSNFGFFKNQHKDSVSQIFKFLREEPDEITVLFSSADNHELVQLKQQQQKNRSFEEV